MIQMAKMPTTDEWVERIGNKVLNEYVYEGRTLKEWIDLMASRKLVILPEKPSNGDVIKALFPDTELHLESDYAFLIFQIGVYLEDRDGRWWNAPYKGGRE